MEIKIIKGNIISAPEFGKLDITEQGYLIAADGKIKGVFQEIPPEFSECEIEDYGDALVMQSFADMHLHAPQYPMLGMGMDMPLLDWLNTYTFPTEARFKDKDFARAVYHRLARELAAKGTTRVCMFSSIHRESTLILMEELENAGITGYVGKVNMDRNGGKNYQETTEESVSETMKWLEECNFEHIKPMITPRFTPSCSNELMQELGRIAKEKNLTIQSHLSENTSELALVKKLHPDCSQYWETYHKYGLWNDKTLMAHCVWSDDRERKAIRDAGVWVVHCPSSNENLVSGYAPVRVMMNEGTNVVLGSDIAGGDHISMFKNITAAIRASKARRIMDNWKTEFLSVAEAFYLGTSAAAPYFGEKPGFAPGNALHALVLEDFSLPVVRPLSVQERFERAVYRREHGGICAVYSEGKKIFSR
jgi:guanine deaminase